VPPRCTAYTGGGANIPARRYVMRATFGVPFGLAVWLVADELAVPALGLSQPPRRQDLATHAYALVAHGVYGLTTEYTRRLVRRRL
jgi:hypothetical protein